MELPKRGIKKLSLHRSFSIVKRDAQEYMIILNSGSAPLKPDLRFKFLKYGMGIQTLAILMLLSGSWLSSFAQQPVSVIFDTDMGPDYDDVGAITLLHAMADNGEATILATIASTQYEGVAAVLNVLNTYFGRPQLPVAVPKGKAVNTKDFQHWSDTLLARYPHKIRYNREVPDAVALYRKLLAQQPDNSVTIITVGFLTNIGNLLQSPADTYSPLNGVQLVEKKVKHMVSMAGRFPEGSEFNIKEDAAAARYAFEHFPRPVIYSGFEIGAQIKSGLPLIHNASIRNSPVKDVFRIGIGAAEEDRQGRKSWDQTAVLVGIRGHNPWYTLKPGRIVVDEKGYNRWATDAKGQAYLEVSQPASTVAAIINELMQHQPK
jgi:pyrimidine-specific ribonucleoside hydrolase